MSSIAWVFRTNQNTFDLKTEAKNSNSPAALPSKSPGSHFIKTILCANPALMETQDFRVASSV